MNTVDKRKTSYHYDVVGLWISGWLSALVSAGVSYGAYLVYLMSGGVFPPALVLGCVLTILSGYFFLVGTLALFSWRLPMAEVDDSGLTLYTGVVGSRMRLSLKWQDLECAFVAKKVECASFFRLRMCRVFGKDLEREVLENVLVLRIKPLLGAQKANEVQRFCSRGFYDRHFRSNDQHTEIWMVKPPREGVSSFLSEAEEHISIQATEREPHTS